MNRGKLFLEERLINFAVSIIKLSEKLPKTTAGNHINGQLIRSGTSPAANFGEARGAESKKDFIHKTKICIKELNETLNWLKIIKDSELVKQKEMLDSVLTENDELISRLDRTIKIARGYIHDDIVESIVKKMRF